MLLVPLTLVVRIYFHVGPSWGKLHDLEGLNNLVLPIKIHPVVFPWILLLPEHKKNTLKYSSFKSAKSYLNVDFLFDPYLYIFVYGLLSVFRSTKVVR